MGVLQYRPAILPVESEDDRGDDVLERVEVAPLDPTAIDCNPEGVFEIREETAERGAVEDSPFGERDPVVLDQPLGFAEMIVLVQPFEDPDANRFDRSGLDSWRHRLRYRPGPRATLSWISFAP